MLRSFTLSSRFGHMMLALTKQGKRRVGYIADIRAANIRTYKLLLSASDAIARQHKLHALKCQVPEQSFLLPLLEQAGYGKAQVACGITVKGLRKVPEAIYSIANWHLMLADSDWRV